MNGDRGMSGDRSDDERDSGGCGGVTYSRAPWVTLRGLPDDGTSGERRATCDVPRQRELDVAIVTMTLRMPYRLSARQMRYVLGVCGQTFAGFAGVLGVDPTTMSHWLSARSGRRPSVMAERAFRNGVLDGHTPLGRLRDDPSDDPVPTFAQGAGAVGVADQDGALAFVWTPERVGPGKVAGVEGRWVATRGSGWLVQDGAPAPFRSCVAALAFHGGDPSTASPIADQLLEVRASLQRGDELLVASPYINVHLISRLVRGTKWRLITDLDACLGARPEPRLVKFLAAYRDRIRHVPDVHMKLVMHGFAAFSGSANLTKAGVAGRAEVTSLDRDRGSRRRLRAFFERTWASGQQLTEQHLAERHLARRPTGRDGAPGVTADATSIGAGAASAAGARVVDASPLDPCWFARAGWLRSVNASEVALRGMAQRLRAGQRAVPMFADLDEPGTELAAREPTAEQLLAEGEAVLGRLQQATRRVAVARWMLKLVEEARAVCGVAEDDPRIVMPAASTKASLLRVVVNRRRVISFTGASQRVVLLLDRLPGGPSASPSEEEEGWRVVYRHSNGAVSVELPLADLAEHWPALRPSWHQAIRAELTTCSRSSHRCRHSTVMQRLLSRTRNTSRIASAVHRR